MKNFIVLSMNAHTFLFPLILMGKLHVCVKYRIKNILNIFLKKNIR